MIGDQLEPGVLRFDVEYPERLSRLLIFIKWFLAVPHLVVLYFMGIAVAIVTFIAWFAILFTGRFPRGLWEFCVTYQIWSANVGSYLLLLRDEYPPFGDSSYPVEFDLVYPPRFSRGLIFIKWLLIFPHLFLLIFLGIAAYVVIILSWFAILILGRYPRGMFNFVVGLLRWVLRANLYTNLLTDRYPPFSME